METQCSSSYSAVRIIDILATSTYLVEILYQIVIWLQLWQDQPLNSIQ